MTNGAMISPRGRNAPNPLSLACWETALPYERRASGSRARSTARATTCAHTAPEPKPSARWTAAVAIAERPDIAAYYADRVRAVTVPVTRLCTGG
jgi:hypothetical protein